MQRHWQKYFSLWANGPTSIKQSGLWTSVSLPYLCQYVTSFVAKSTLLSLNDPKRSSSSSRSCSRSRSRATADPLHKAFASCICYKLTRHVIK